MTALRFNEGKPKLSYFRRSFRQALHAIARIKEFGANKYEEDNWRAGGKPDQEYWDSFDRHVDLFLNGEKYDTDSGCHHLGHAIWNLCALFELNYGDDPVIDEQIFAERMEYWRQQKELRKKGKPIDKVPVMLTNESVIRKEDAEKHRESLDEINGRRLH